MVKDKGYIFRNISNSAHKLRNSLLKWNSEISREVRQVPVKMVPVPTDGPTQTLLNIVVIYLQTEHININSSNKYFVYIFGLNL